MTTTLVGMIDGSIVSSSAPYSNPAHDGAIDGSGVGDIDGSGVGAIDGSGDGAIDGSGVGAIDGSGDGTIDGSGDGAIDGSGVGAIDGSGDGDIDGSGDGASVGDNVSIDTSRTSAPDIERRRLAASSSAEADPSWRWPSAVAKCSIAAVRLPSATDALNTLITYCYAPSCTRAVSGAIAS